MTGSLVTLLLVVATAVILRWRRPAWYWMTFGVTLAALRVAVRYASVMDACGLTVPPARWRLSLARMTNRPVPESRAPRILRLRPTRTGLVLRIKLRPGQDAFDVASATDRLRHSFGMYGVTSRELRSGIVELRMTGYDVLRRVQMPAETGPAPMRIPVALREDGSVHYRDYRAVPHGLTLGVTESGKSVYQRNLVAGLAAHDVALVGIDCSRASSSSARPALLRPRRQPGHRPRTPRALVQHMEDVYQLIRSAQRITVDVPDADIAADIWDLPADIRPTPVVVLVDEVAELALFATKDEEKRRDRIVTALVRLAQLGRAAGIYLEICGQRFGSELGKGITMLRAQLTGRTAHRVNDESSANMAFGDIAPDAVLAAIQIPTDVPGIAVSGDSTGGWTRIRAPHTSLRQAVNICNRHADRTPDVPALAAFRPAVAPLASATAPLTKAAPTTA
ncbi:DNA segregation ATPase FtsK/SpoIIIE, S-DNA-T family [Streptomyces sp. BpilaLS-43]|uniref:FtsK/SpoIIIE domain-containing protein n=1 Tax=Streptomyces sp. BpilaLS-43 TaxID=1839778 RepID=UPI00081B7538|nr:FtsK/SpoIIIE domain-containing protein [Streptomyces sp. BpilaLS-43]SCD37395.1 DNA segregation ATPase FtsK/SpoIIIE, S-DNA-T family [Streptomyces sp. BpilaLS-43]